MSTPSGPMTDTRIPIEEGIIWHAPDGKGYVPADVLERVKAERDSLLALNPTPYGVQLRKGTMWWCTTCNRQGEAVPVYDGMDRECECKDQRRQKLIELDAIESAPLSALVLAIAERYLQQELRRLHALIESNRDND
jgi:hypothetical protein